MTPEDREEIARLEARIAELKAKDVEPVREPEPAPEPNFRKPKPASADQERKQRLIAAGAIGAVLIGIWAMYASGNKASPIPSAQSATSTATITPVAPAEPAPPPEPPSPWTYTVDRDPMNDAANHLACTTSTNQAQLGFPYGSVSATLCVRQTKKWGLDVYVALIGDGQFMCSSYDGCRMKARFDTAEARTYGASGADDNSTNIIFVNDGVAPGFLQRLKGASTTKVEVSFYQAGNQVLEFNTKGLDWPRSE